MGIIFITIIVLYNKGQTPENEHNGSFSGLVNGSSCQGEVNLLKTSCHAHFQGMVDGGGGQIKVKPPKMSMMAHFWGLWLVVVARER
jgi:hypothetical protein